MILDYFLVFLSGGILSNSLPSLVWGMSGRHFPAYTEEERKHLPKIVLLISAPFFNAVWGLINLFVALALLMAIDFQLAFDFRSLFFALGVIVVVLVTCIKMTQVHSARE
ncbi:MAG: hypothetical protein JXR70_02055 [Spirochaetales bacterium]|nr:hypothetical protein [Spirochaetales bacterium]